MSASALKQATEELTSEGWLTKTDPTEAQFYNGLRDAVMHVLQEPAWKGKYITADDCPALSKAVRARLKKDGFSFSATITAVKGKLEFIVKEAGA